MRHSLFAFLFIIISFSSPGQSNVDSIFNLAISHSRAGNYDKALIEAGKALHADSTRADIYVFTANLLSWNNNNEYALTFIQKASRMNYLTEDYYNAHLNILLRSKKYKELLITCEEAGKNNYSNKIILAKFKLLAYEGLLRYDDIINFIAENQNEDFLTNNDIKYIYNSAKQKQQNQSLITSYSMDIIQGATPQHFFSVGYMSKIKNISTIFTVNYANRYAKNDVQLEYTAYLSQKNKNYWYLNYGGSFEASLFPKHRAGLEHYFKIHNKWDASLGGRYLHYPLADHKDVWILTGNIGTYARNNWISIRPFYVIRSDIQSLSVVAKYRLYEINSLSFWGVELSMGNSPDDMFATTQGSFNQLIAYRIKMEKNIAFQLNSELLIGLSYVYEELLQNSSINNRNRFVFDLGYRFKF